MAYTNVPSLLLSGADQNVWFGAEAHFGARRVPRVDVSWQYSFQEWPQWVSSCTHTCVTKLTLVAKLWTL